MGIGIFVNPRRACAARVTVVNPRRAKICEDLPETIAFKSYVAKYERKSQYANLPAYPRSAFSTRRTAWARGYSAIINNIQPCPKTMPTDAASPGWSEN